MFYHLLCTQFCSPYYILVSPKTVTFPDLGHLVRVPVHALAPGHVPHSPDLGLDHTPGHAHAPDLGPDPILMATTADQSPGPALGQDQGHVLGHYPSRAGEGLRPS